MVVTTSLLGGGSEAPRPDGPTLHVSPAPRGSTSGAAVPSFRDFVDGTDVDESMQAAIFPNLPADANAVVTAVYPSDWTRNTPLPDGQAENATDWEAVYALSGGETLRVVMGLPVPYERGSSDACGGESRPGCITRADGTTVEEVEYQYDNTNQGQVFVRAARVTTADGFATTAMESVDASQTPPDWRPTWPLTRTQLIAIADSDGLTFPPPVVLPSTQAPKECRIQISRSYVQ